MARGKLIGRLPDTGVEQIEYTPEKFVPFLKGLVAASKQSLRQISLGSGLDPGATRRYIHGAKPSRDACIALAQFFNVHPNEMLEKAGYPTRGFFDLSLADPAEFAPEVKEVAQELMKIEEMAIRRRVCNAVLQLVREMFTQISETGAKED